MTTMFICIVYVTVVLNKYARTSVDSKMLVNEIMCMIDSTKGSDVDDKGKSVHKFLSHKQ